MKSLAPSQLSAIEQAQRFFLAGCPKGAGDDLNPTIADSDGLVSYTFPVANTPPEELMADIRELDGKLQALIGVVTAYVLQTTADDPTKLHDFNTWYEPFAQLGAAWFAGFKSAERNIDKTVTGVEIATAFIEILLNATVDGTAAMADFAKFIKSQGDSMRAESTDDGQGYKYAVLNVAHEVFPLADGSWVYVPKLRCQWTEFSRESFSITLANCASIDKHHFKFHSQELTGAFNYELWKGDETYRKKLDDFIDEVQSVNIAKSANFFTGKFKSKQSA